MIVVTYVYRPNAGTERMINSVKNQGYEIAVLNTNDNPADIMKELFLCYKRAIGGHDKVIYADAADSYFQRRVAVPDDVLLYSTEKQCFPFPAWADKYPPGGNWKYLNNGGFCGPLELVIEFYEKYQLHSIKINSQAAVMDAYFQARAAGFPIELDVECYQFQSIAFEEPGEFKMNQHGFLENIITGTMPAVLHGNGLTPLEKFIR